MSWTADVAAYADLFEFDVFVGHLADEFDDRWRVVGGCCGA